MPLLASLCRLLASLCRCWRVYTVVGEFMPFVGAVNHGGYALIH